MVPERRERKFTRRRPNKDMSLPEDLERKVIDIRRVAKVRAGAKRFRFSAIVAVGDRNGRVCVALGRGNDTKSAVNKAVKYAADHLAHIDLIGDTVPHVVIAKYGAAKLLIKPAGPGTGVTASGPVRAVMEVAGIRNILTKELGSSNAVTNAYCTVEALKKLDKRRIIRRRSEGHAPASTLVSTKREIARNTTTE